MYNWRQTLLPILLLFFSLLFDGFITSFWIGDLVTSFGVIVPRFIVLILIILSFHYSLNFMLGMAILFGFTMDAYYIGFIGVYMAAFVLLVYIFSNLKKIYNPTVWSYTLFSILGITIVELFVYGIMRILDITTLPLQMFLANRLGATLLFNALVMVLISFIVEYWIESVMDEG